MHVRERHQQPAHLDEGVFAGEGAIHDVVALSLQVEVGFASFAHFKG